MSYPILSLIPLHQISPWDLLTSDKQLNQPQMKLLFPTSSAASVISTETFEIHTMPHANPLRPEPLYSLAFFSNYPLFLSLIYIFPFNTRHKTILSH